VGKDGGEGQGGEMTQTIYAHVNKWTTKNKIKNKQTTIKKTLTTGVDKDVGKKEPSYSAGGNAS
jgi:hypothetical protein